jgi:hypothetical protein
VKPLLLKQVLPNEDGEYYNYESTWFLDFYGGEKPGVCHASWSGKEKIKLTLFKSATSLDSSYEIIIANSLDLFDLVSDENGYFVIHYKIDEIGRVSVGMAFVKSNMVVKALSFITREYILECQNKVVVRSVLDA